MINSFVNMCSFLAPTYPPAVEAIAPVTTPTPRHATPCPLH